MENIAVLLVEDDEMVREGLRLVVERLPGARVVGEAADGREALLLVKDLQPRVVLLDLFIPFVDGISFTREVRRRYPSIAVVVLTGYPDEMYLTGALNAGATGYLLKSSDPDELDIALHAAVRGETYITPRMATYLTPNRVDTIHDLTTP
jgi:DNA-binding NarL/FixJ family response regulator